MFNVNRKYVNFIIDDFTRAGELHKNCESCLTLEELEFKRDMCIGALWDYENDLQKDVTLANMRKAEQDAKIARSIINDAVDRIDELFDKYTHSKKEDLWAN